MYLELKENKPHGTPDYPYTQYHIRNRKKAFQIPVHWHQELEVIYIEKGALHITISGSSYEGRDGSIFFVNPGELHFMESSDLSVSYYTILFPLEFISFQTQDGLEEDLMLPLRSGRLQFPTSLTEQGLCQRSGAILKQIIQINRDKSPFHQLHTRAQLLLLLEELLVSDTLLRPTHAHTAGMQREILSFVQQHHTEKLTLEDLSREFHLSEKYLSRYFRQHFSLGFKQYVGHLRLSTAKNLLTSEEMSITDVALNSGYPNVSLFIRSFKSAYQMTPLQYRKRWEKQNP